MLKFLLLLFLFIVFIGGIFGFNIGKFLYGNSRRSDRYRQNQNPREDNQKQSRKAKKTTKLILKEEGEYVDFEEIKE